MTLDPSIEVEMRREYKRIRENNLLILGILIGIIGSLIAGVINDLIKTSTFYPWIYLFVLIGIIIILVFVLLVPYINWKRFLYILNKRMKEMKKVLDRTKEHRKKYPLKNDK